jgi:uncharacterized protein
VRIFLDTNVLVSAYSARGISADLMRLILAEHELLTGKVNLAELLEVLGQRFGAPQSQLTLIERQLRDATVIPKPTEASALPIRDPDDAWVLASAVDGQAHMLVTGDKDLLSIAHLAPLPIVNPRDCWERLRKGA